MLQFQLNMFSKFAAKNFAPKTSQDVFYQKKEKEKKIATDFLHSRAIIK